MGFCFRFNVQAKCLNQTVHSLTLYTLSLIQHIVCISQMIVNLSILLPRAGLGDGLPVATVFSEDVEEFAPQAWLPRFNQALGVDHQPAGLPVLMTSHYILRPWKRDSRTNWEWCKEQVKNQPIQKVHAWLYNYNKPVNIVPLCQAWINVARNYYCENARCEILP